MEREEVLNNFYANDCDEDTRLDCKYRKLEFLTTDKYVNKFLNSDSKILEIGAGTGRYSIHYARMGYDVTSIEYVEHNLEILKSKITPEMKIRAEQGDAVDLSRFEDKTFDVVLVFGPLYHLFTEEDINKCINEAKRVCKDDGVMMFAYLPNDSIILSWGLLKGNLLKGKEEKLYDENFTIVSKASEIMRAFYIDELENIMNSNGIKKVHHISTSGVAPHFRDAIENLSDEEFKLWEEYHYSSCERKEMQGFSTHMLFIGKKDI